MRALGIDFGSKRIGVAVSDELGLTVRGVETVQRRGERADLERLRSIVEELEPEAIVVGLPLRMDGTAGEAAHNAMRFIERLREELAVPVYAQDERLTSYEAEQLMIERGYDRQERRARSDQFAAMIILEEFLARRDAANQRTGEDLPVA